MDELQELWSGGPRYAGDPVWEDSTVLADFAQRAASSGEIWDLGCGSGILALLLMPERPEQRYTGVELRPTAAERARRNLEANGLSGRCRVIAGDLRDIRAAGAADLVVSNPPFFPAGRGAVSPDPDRAASRTESATLSELCRAAASLLRTGGSFCLVHRTERMAEVFAAMAASGLEPKRARMIDPGPGKTPEGFLCEGRKGARPGLLWEPALLRREADGRESAEYRRITRRDPEVII